MGQTIKAWLFIDRLRSVVTILALLIGVGFLVWQTTSPRPVKLDEESLTTIKDATETMRRAAHNSEQLVKDNQLFKATIAEQLKTQSKLRDANYDILFEQYGVSVKPNAISSDPPRTGIGLQSLPDSIGGLAIPPDESRPDRVQQLRYSVKHSPEADDRSTTGVPGGSSSAPSE